MKTLRQTDFLQYLDNEEIQLFTVESIRQSLSSDSKTLNGIVEALVRKGFLCRLERGKYCRSTFRDENVLGTFIVPDGAIAYWSALNLHGFTEQFPNTVFVQTTCKKTPVAILGTSYQFVKVEAKKRTGIAYNGYGNYRYPITDIEKTFVDCFDLPQYSGGYAELIRAFAGAKPDAKKLTDYCTMVNNIAVIKRLGFLSELLKKEEMAPFIAFARTKVNRSYNLFDPLDNDKGENTSDWYLRLNLSKESIINIVQNLY
jgi:predicted transcriptional regulator of viral defense system